MAARSKDSSFIGGQESRGGGQDARSWEPRSTPPLREGLSSTPPLRPGSGTQAGTMRANSSSTLLSLSQAGCCSPSPSEPLSHSRPRSGLARPISHQGPGGRATGRRGSWVRCANSRARLWRPRLWRPNRAGARAQAQAGARARTRARARAWARGAARARAGAAPAGAGAGQARLRTALPPTQPLASLLAGAAAEAVPQPRPQPQPQSQHEGARRTRRWRR